VGGVPNHVSDGGPSSDSIGPACDSGGPFSLSTTVANGHYHASYATHTICIGAATTACSFGPTTVAVVSSSVANPSVITTAAAHGFLPGEAVTIAGHTGSTPSINGTHVVFVTGATTFTIPVNVTVGGTGGTATAPNDADGDRVVNASDSCRTVPNTPVRFGPNLNEAPGEADTFITAQVDGDTFNVDDAAGFVAGSAILIDSPNETLRYITGIAGNTIDIQPTIGLGSHGLNDRVSQIAYAQTARDLTNDGLISFADIGLLTGEFGAPGPNYFGGTAVGSYAAVGYQGRYDINEGVPNQDIGFADIGRLTSTFGASC